MRQIATELLSHVEIWAHDNTIELQESRPLAFVAFIYAVRAILRFQANFVCGANYVHNARENDAMRE